MKVTVIPNGTAGKGNIGSWSIGNAMNTGTSSGQPGPSGGDSSLSTQVTVGKPQTNGGGVAPKSGSPNLSTEI